MLPALNGQSAGYHEAAGIERLDNARLGIEDAAHGRRLVGIIRQYHEREIRLRKLVLVGAVGCQRFNLAALRDFRHDLVETVFDSAALVDPVFNLCRLGDAGVVLCGALVNPIAGHDVTVGQRRTVTASAKGAGAAIDQCQHGQAGAKADESAMQEWLAVIDDAATVGDGVSHGCRVGAGLFGLAEEAGLRFLDHGFRHIDLGLPFVGDRASIDGINAEGRVNLAQQHGLDVVILLLFAAAHGSEEAIQGDSFLVLSAGAPLAAINGRGAFNLAAKSADACHQFSQQAFVLGNSRCRGLRVVDPVAQHAGLLLHVPQTDDLADDEVRRRRVLAQESILLADGVDVDHLPVAVA